MNDVLRPARIVFDDASAPRSLDYDDVYHPRAGAAAQARHVFLGGNQLPARWARRRHFVIVETGFGLGHNFLACWEAWRADPQRCEHLWFVSVEKHPPRRDDLLRAHGDRDVDPSARLLIDAWPPLTPDLHALEFDGGRVSLRLAFGDARHWLPQWMVQADAFMLDGFAPDRNPALWSAELLARLRHLAAPGATAATWSVARAVRDGLESAGFEVARQPGFGAKREMLVARFAPGYALRVPEGRRFGRGGTAAVVGAGLAGAAAADALRRHGVPVTVFEQQAHVAQGASGQRGGLLHGVVHADDGPYARWHRAAFLHAARGFAAGIAQERVVGRLNGLLRRERHLGVAELRQRAHALALPDDYARPLDAGQAVELSAGTAAWPAWLFPTGGWVDPRSAVSAWLGHDNGIELRAPARVNALRRAAGGRWQLLDGQGRVLAEVDHVVLANAHDTQRLAGPLEVALRSVRGQVTMLPADATRLPALPLPLAGDGYVLALRDGDWLCGATHDVDDAHADLRDDDHRRNLDTLSGLLGRQVAIDPARVTGRVAWRLSTPDRLPLVGSLPSHSASVRPDQPRFLPRHDGLHVLAALGSRGLAQSALGGEIVASWISGAPMPVASDTLDAVDVARWSARVARIRNAAS